ncbi:hypothetical protein M3197_11395 [Sporosarcina aquimarina]|uniref:hypothetical protein n=1 Tax=Sporosarcina aquimarina TaxID=114975 RepID=UPI002041016C|nr:hypothetical protein [Sporosarcina aquimarina]MCM3758068.1 hypothetical protein [Sporosarcina aquimarina]
MINKNWISIGVIVISITLLMACDFFPKLNEVLSIPKPIVSVFLLLMLFVGCYTTPLLKNNTLRFNFLWGAATVIYLMGLIIVFSLLGGNSQVGLSLSSPALWIVLAISVFELYREFKKLKAAQPTP